ncbi:hypothetical protein M409DRAFT_19584 [Zasmidium cellare ATCC 36951]|uniref:Uncharacterized protein n=1 Tax=Zasmidium cellare ATCC 36951 TaxID=1080233 RepID=A0A6A6CVZ4_ZASCE|nr:uncharacterized protein M409DRAFT_19584 [Zasmidium cellare ATCC 36951]KAF2169969.1 hypothetical protein M409DRAFT_19584 [Zasmidium cellare ATCC 36951]
MDNLSSTFLVLFTIFFAPSMAQDGSPMSSPTSSTTDGMPTHSDQAHDGDQGKSDTVSLVNYYFVFLALVVCFAALAAYFMYKRKKKYGMIIRQSREGALQRDLNTWDPIRARRRYWQGRWRSADHSREEGLNEFGEAPPPYVPKSSEGEPGQQNVTNGPAVPLQTLSREQAGLKPPDYTEAHVQAVPADTGSSPTNPDNNSREVQHPQPTQPSELQHEHAPSQAPRYG